RLREEARWAGGVLGPVRDAEVMHERLGMLLGDQPVELVLGGVASRLADRASSLGGVRSVALVGLGTGTTACYARPGERWTYYEIDPLVVAIASTPQLFTYLRDCQPDVKVVIGDARLSLAAAPDASFDLITLDAFSSDAIPVHLMTREALQLYTRKLRPGGVVAFHISNRYLDLYPVLVELARDARLAGAMANRDVSDAQKAKLYYSSRWVALAANAHTLAPLVREAGWEVLAPSAPLRVWTDDYSDVLGALK
ncbi:MAG: fused MFS/spermidine synthase, partial [Gemmatimonadota bacterium]